MPSATRPDKNAKSPRPITTTPVDLKNNGAYFECAKEADPKESKESIGRVPRAKENMMSRPAKNDPLDSAATCMDWVKPQGKKKVPKPIISGARARCSIFLKKLKIPEGRVILFLANTPTKLRPSKIIIKEAKSPKIAVRVKLMLKAPPIAPSIPPKMAKLPNRPR